MVCEQIIKLMQNEREKKIGMWVFSVSDQDTGGRATIHNVARRI